MNASEIRYPIGVQSFKKLREEGYTYVDKTQYIPLLLRNNYYFLSRPRRFGKSLLLSMLEAYFRGQKELFEGLAVYKWEKEWLEYPVIRVDFNSMNGTDINSLITDLKKNLREMGISYGLVDGLWQQPDFEDNSIGYIFSQLVRQLWEKTGRKVVILIDEYDKGIIEVLEDEDKRLLATDTLRPFFSVLKSDDEYIKFTFITGVSRFRNTTIFSGANNLRDISMSEEFASLLGITQKELEDNFTPSISEMALKQEWTFDETLLRLRNQYDGYRFTSSRELVYNPFSLLNCFQDKALKDYWVQSGSSRILAIYLKGSDFALEELTDKWVNVSRLGATYSRRDPVSLLFQTGYLTISEYDRELNEVKLRIPNQEVQGMMTEILIPEFVKGIGLSEIEDKLSVLRRAVVKGDVETMMKTLRSLLSAVPYHEADKVAEKHLHLCIQIVFLLLGVNARSETSISGGRVDMVATTPKRVYVFEFKLDRSAGEALKQIDEKGYALQWTAAGHTVYKIGVEFSSRLRTIASWTYTVQQ